MANIYDDANTLFIHELEDLVLQLSEKCRQGGEMGLNICLFDDFVKSHSGIIPNPTHLSVEVTNKS